MLEGGQRRAGQPRRAIFAGSGEAAQVERYPDQRAHDRQREQQVGGETEMADVGAVGEARHHHIPAEHALRPAEHEQADHLPAIAPGDRAPTREPGERKREGEPDHAAEQAVQPFPEIYLLEGGEGHARGAVDLPIFGRRLVKVEGGPSRPG